MSYFYCVHTRYRNDSVVYKDTLMTADSIKMAAERAKGRLAGSGYDDGSLPEFVKAERLSIAAAQKLYNQNPIDWIEHENLRDLID